MSLTTDNARYAAKLKSLFAELPSEGLKAASSRALQVALTTTVQDSGEAAYNWSIAWNGEAMQSYVHAKGQNPVGKPYDKRGAGYRPLIGYTLAEQKAQMPAEAISAKLYNPLNDPEHEFAAGVDHAGNTAMDYSALNMAAEGAVNAYLRRRY